MIIYTITVFNKIKNIELKLQHCLPMEQVENHNSTRETYS